MAFIHRVLQVPSYGWQDAEGELVVPSGRQLFAEAFSRVNIFASRRNWISFLSWASALCVLPFLSVFLVHYFSWPLVGVALVYGFVVMSTHGTIWYHRYCTHRAYTFSHPLWRVLTQHLVVKTIPEETYVLSHHVHHALSDRPGDPYNARGGFLYCMLADVNHQRVAPDLDEADYARARGLLDHTGVLSNGYARYQAWATVAAPGTTLLCWLLNWGWWYGVFFLLGGHGLACALFSAALLWCIGVRNFNYTSHGKGQAAHVEGLDLDRRNLSLNQWRPGYVSGEWHNNHHLFPGSARSGFLRYQLDLAWVYIYSLHKLGLVASYRDSKKQFLQRYAEREG